MKGWLAKSIALSVLFIGSSAIAGISGGALRSVSVPRLLIVGPVEAVNVRQGVAVVLGQKLPLDVFGDVDIGTSVSVYGVLGSTGTIKIQRIEQNGQYVAGASPVFLTAVVQRIVPSLGRAVVGGLKVDLTDPGCIYEAQSISLDSVVMLLGTQPNIGGLVLVRSLGDSALQGISGGALQGISGGALQGISGGALQGISGGADSVN